VAEPEVADAPPAAPTERAAPPVAEPEAAAPPAAPTEPAAPPVVSGPTVVPTFDVVRVEPSGETVVAGLAEPQATVEVLDGPIAVATAEANARGEWAISLDEPLPPGTHDLAIRTTSQDRRITMLSDQRVAVSVPEDKSTGVLVVLNAPEAPSKVLQLPGARAPEVALAPAAEPAMPSAAPAELAPAVVEAAPVEKPSAGPTPPAETVVAAEPVPVPEEGPAGAPLVAAEPEVALAPAAGPQAAQPSKPEIAVAPAAEVPPPAQPAIQPAVTVAAVEADTAGGLYVAGTAETDEPVRVYLDNQPIGETTPTPSGTWLLEAKRELATGTYQVRADQLDKATGTVIARAEVPFEREIEVATLKPTATIGAADGTALSGAAPQLETLIIKRGDNLWRIARRVYGRGIRYSTIYQANRDQIRNPHWIYPGQVLVVPAGDTKWQN
jgi:nucleoid-associated protein YgaU